LDFSGGWDEALETGSVKKMNPTPFLEFSKAIILQ
jgi:hypothetical protein